MTHAMPALTMPLHFHVYDCNFCNKTMLQLIFWPVKAAYLLINIHKRRRKCLQKASVGLLTGVMRWWYHTINTVNLILSRLLKKGPSSKLEHLCSAFFLTRAIIFCPSVKMNPLRSNISLTNDNDNAGKLNIVVLLFVQYNSWYEFLKWYNIIYNIVQ